MDRSARSLQLSSTSPNGSSCLLATLQVAPGERRVERIRTKVWSLSCAYVYDIKCWSDSVASGEPLAPLPESNQTDVPGPRRNGAVILVSHALCLYEVTSAGLEPHTRIGLYTTALKLSSGLWPLCNHNPQSRNVEIIDLYKTLVYCLSRRSWTLA